MICEEKTVIEMMNSHALSAEQRTALKGVLYKLNYAKGFFVQKPISCKVCCYSREENDLKTLKCRAWAPCMGREVPDTFFCKNAVLQPELGEMEDLAERLFCENIPFEIRDFYAFGDGYCTGMLIVKPNREDRAIFATPNRDRNKMRGELITVFQINLKYCINTLSNPERIGNFTARETIGRIKELFFGGMNDA